MHIFVVIREGVFQVCLVGLHAELFRIHTGELLRTAADHHVKIVEFSGVHDLGVPLGQKRTVYAEAEASVEAHLSRVLLVSVKQFPGIPTAQVLNGVTVDALHEFHAPLSSTLRSSGCMKPQ